MRYPVNIEKEPTGPGWNVSFPDIPEALTCGDTFEDALEMAKDCLVTAMDFYVEDRRAVPAPSKAKRDQPVVDLPASVASKILLLNEMVRQKVRPIDMAAQLGVSKQTFNRVMDLQHPTKVDQIADALKLLGKRLELSVA